MTHGVFFILKLSVLLNPPYRFKHNVFGYRIIFEIGHKNTKLAVSAY